MVSVAVVFIAATAVGWGGVDAFVPSLTVMVSCFIYHRASVCNLYNLIWRRYGEKKGEPPGLRLLFFYIEARGIVF